MVPLEVGLFGLSFTALLPEWLDFAEYRLKAVSELLPDLPKVRRSHVISTKQAVISIAHIEVL